MIVGITYYKSKTTGLNSVDVIVPIMKSSADNLLIFTRSTDKYIKRRTALRIMEEQLMNMNRKELWSNCLDLGNKAAFTRYKKSNYEIILHTEVVDLDVDWIVNMINTFKMSSP